MVRYARIILKLDQTLGKTEPGVGFYKLDVYIYIYIYIYIYTHARTHTPHTHTTHTNTYI